jgi:nucleoside-diphosphate-sugar epimerase
MPIAFFTGFPGFLGSELLPRLLSRAPDTTAVCLVQPRFASLARQRAEQLIAAQPSLGGRIRLVEGDITHPDLGLGDAGELKRETAEIFHLAAVYDLSVSRDLGMRVNVQGTRHVLRFATECPGLRRLHYASTCYVSGRTPGIFSEDDLDRGQQFNNFYEETKFLAEVEVRAGMSSGLPATIYRPSIVVGDSATGATQKYDGPYYVLRWILRQPRVAFVPVVGDPQTRVNVVPRDFTVAAIAHLSGLPRSVGKVYALADPDPLRVGEMLEELARAAGRRLVRLRLPLGLAKGALAYVPGVYRLMGIPASAVDYFAHPTLYDTQRAQQDLAGSGIEAPPFRSYVDRLVAFVRQHPDLGSEAMV